jgi:hypothetical protein
MNSRAESADVTTSKLLPRAAWLLGIAGLWPQLACVALMFDDRTRFMALSAGYFYAALIFSFLGGLWWGLAVATSRTPAWVYAAAVVPSLIAFSSGVPWMIGARWPGPSLAVLALGLFASLVVDIRLNRLGIMPTDMLRLRTLLSTGLSCLTMLLSVL